MGNLQDMIREQKSVVLEVIPVDSFKEDDDTLTATLAAFLNSRRGTMVTLGASQGTNYEDSLDLEVVDVQLQEVHVDVYGETEEKEQELPVEPEQDDQNLKRDE